MTITPVTVPGFPRLPVPFNNITPFTYRDGWTYLEVLEALREHLVTVIDEVNAGFDGQGAEYIEQLNDLADAVNDAMAAHDTNMESAVEGFKAELATIVSDANTTFADKVDELQSVVDQWSTVTIENNDIITSAILDNPESATTNAVANIARAENNSVNVLHNGVIGDGETDDSAAIQAALDSAVALGLPLYFPARQYRVDTPIIVPSNARINSDGGIIDISRQAAGGAGFTLTGEIVDTGILTMDAEAGNASVSINLTQGIVKNSWIRVRSEDVFTGDTNQRRGEYARVANSTGTVLDFLAPLADSYNVADSAGFDHTIPVENVSFNGLSFIGNDDGTAVYGIKMLRAFNVSVTDCNFRYCNGAGIHAVEVISMRVASCSFIDGMNETLSYGVEVSFTSQDIVITNCVGMRLRHLVTLGGPASNYGTPRRVNVTNCNAYGMQNAGFDTHAGSDDVTFSNCHVYGSGLDGIVAQGARVTIEGCSVRYASRFGISVEVLTTDGADCVITNNRVDNSSRGISVRSINGFPGLDVRGVVVSNNRIRGGAYGIFMDNGANVSERYVGGVVSGNTIRDTTSVGIYTTSWSKLAINGNDIMLNEGNLQAAIRLRTSEDCVISNNTLTAPSGTGVLLNDSARALINGNNMEANVGFVNQGSSNHFVLVNNNLRQCVTATDLTGTGGSINENNLLPL